MGLETLNRTFTLGIDLGGTATKVGLFTPIGNLIERIDFGTCSDDPRMLEDDARRNIGELLERNGAGPRSVTSIGIAVPGVVDEQGGLSLCVNVDLDLPGYEAMLHGLMPAARLAAINDANAAALGEVWQGGHAGIRDLLFVALGTGIGAGIIHDGALLLGRGGAAGEIGHLCIDPSESDPCSCGNHGCLEQYVSAKGLAHMVERTLAATDTASTLRRVAIRGAREIFDAAAAGDEAARAAVDVFTSRLALALTQLACILEPEIIVLGGGLSGSADVYLDDLRRLYTTQAFSACRDIPIVRAALGDSAGIYGATYHAAHMTAR